MIEELSRYVTGLLICIAATLQLSCFAQKEPVTLGDKRAIVFDISMQAHTGTVAASLGDRIEVWNYRTKEMLQSWTAPKILAIDFQDSVLTGVSKSGLLYVWNIFSASEIRGISISDSPLTSVRFMDSVSLVAGTESGDVIKFNLRTNKIEFKVKIGNTVTTILNKPESRVIIVGDSRGNLTILNADTGDLIHRIKAHHTWVRNIQSYGRDYLISFSDDGNFITWKLKDDMRLELISKKKQGGWILCGDVFQEKQNGPVLVVTGFQSGLVNVYFTSGKYEFKTKSMVNSIAIIKDDIPKINLILGTHGSGIQLISGDNLKMVK